MTPLASEPSNVSPMTKLVFLAPLLVFKLGGMLPTGVISSLFNRDAVQPDGAPEILEEIDVSNQPIRASVPSTPVAPFVGILKGYEVSEEHRTAERRRHLDTNREWLDGHIRLRLSGEHQAQQAKN